MGTDSVIDRNESLFYPAPLKTGDKIALTSPSSAVKEEFVTGAMKTLEKRGYEPVLMPHALGHVDGSFASTKSERLIDLFDALENSDYKAILCTRGGYGACQLLSKLTPGIVGKNPKWIIGFSDISALHALWYSSGVASIHGPMAKHLATMPSDDPCTESLFEMLENGGRFDYSFPCHIYNHPGKATGTLLGGNFAVLTDLASTKQDILDIPNGQEDVILFLEDIAEPIYKVNRMLWRLYLNGSLRKVKGIIFGQFTEYKGDKNFDTMEDMIKEFIDHTIVPKDLPIVYNFPVGHSDLNYPLTVGAKVELVATGEIVRLRTIF